MRWWSAVLVAAACTPDLTTNVYVVQSQGGDGGAATAGSGGTHESGGAGGVPGGSGGTPATAGSGGSQGGAGGQGGEGGIGGASTTTTSATTTISTSSTSSTTTTTTDGDCPVWYQNQWITCAEWAGEHGGWCHNGVCTECPAPNLNNCNGLDADGCETNIWTNANCSECGDTCAPPLTCQLYGIWHVCLA